MTGRRNHPLLWQVLLMTGQMLMCACVCASPTLFSSGSARVGLLELYTSEGCSSCPPADRWISSLKTNRDLWKSLVPVAFHVDYWDNIGWPDRFADSRYSERQRNYRRAEALSGVYTPGFVWQGQEWRGFFTGGRLPALTAEDVGDLRASIDGRQVQVRFQPVRRLPRRLRLFAALLGFGLKSDVSAGENRGRRLSHDFAVLRLLTTALQRDDQAYYGAFELNRDSADGDRHALALWVSTQSDPRPIQSTGGWLQE